ncbi:MAG: hypothetical protein ACR2K1_11560, partial [Saprospiraceae bacterium]
PGVSIRSAADPYGMTGPCASLGALECGTGRFSRPRRGGKVTGEGKVMCNTFVHSGGGRSAP